MKQDQLRKAEIAGALANLRLKSHPGEFYDELSDWVLGHYQTPEAISSLLRQLQKKYPDNFATAVRSMKLPSAPIGRPQKFSEQDNALLFAAFRHSSSGMEKFARRCAVEDANDSAADSMQTRLKRLSRRYKDELEFRTRVDELRGLLKRLYEGS